MHPERLWSLFRRASWPQKLLTLLLLGLVFAGAWTGLAPFHVQVALPDPPPFTQRLDCPPPPIAAVSGQGGFATPRLDLPDAEALHDSMCRSEGRRRALSGLLLVAAGVLNAAAVLEWARNRRRAKRRRRRAKRAAARRREAEDAAGRTGS
jgi:hypothetical protein